VRRGKRRSIIVRAAAVSGLKSQSVTSAPGICSLIAASAPGVCDVADVDDLPAGAEQQPRGAARLRAGRERRRERGGEGGV